MAVAGSARLFPWIRSLGFNQCEADNCVFSMTTAGDALYVGCYVDDLFILYLQDGADSLYASLRTSSRSAGK